MKYQDHIRIPVDLLAREDLNSLDKCLYVLLGERFCHSMAQASQDQFARMLGVSLGSIVRSVERLRAAGLIETKRTLTGLRYNLPADCAE
jgi:DNA-binding MarR family transcriptional regulator